MSLPIADLPPTTLLDRAVLRQQSPATAVPVKTSTVSAFPIPPYEENGGLGDLPMAENMSESGCNPKPDASTATNVVDISEDATATTNIDRSNTACSSSTSNQHGVTESDEFD
ncbi:hypothetical protein V6N13_109199 [Hibiscus sabdariffa]